MHTSTTPSASHDSVFFRTIIPCPERTGPLALSSAGPYPSEPPLRPKSGKTPLHQDCPTLVHGGRPEAWGRPLKRKVENYVEFWAPCGRHARLQLLNVLYIIASYIKHLHWFHMKWGGHRRNKETAEQRIHFRCVQDRRTAGDLAATFITEEVQIFYKSILIRYWHAHMCIERGAGHKSISY